MSDEALTQSLPNGKQTKRSPDIFVASEWQNSHSYESSRGENSPFSVVGKNVSMIRLGPRSCLEASRLLCQQVLDMVKETQAPAQAPIFACPPEKLAGDARRDVP